jgi:transmembrane sensor
VNDHRETDVQPGALQVEQQAADWLIQQRDCGAWSSEDEAALESWLQASLPHRITYLRLKAAWENADRLSALRSAGPMRVRLQSQPQPKRFAQARIVAAVVVAMLCGAAAYSFLTFPPADRTFSTAVGGHEIVTLTDKTRIELNTDTSIRTRVTASERTVWLDKGEALFTVQHDATHPFVVIAGSRRITDLGTQFSVRRDKDRLKVALFSGRAYLDQTDNPSSGASALLKPGDVAIATNRGLRVSKETNRALAESLGWRSGTVVFDHTALADAVAEFNRYSDHKLMVGDSSVGRITIGGTFDIRNVEAFADIVKHAIGLRIEERDGKTVISR